MDNSVPSTGWVSERQVFLEQCHAAILTGVAPATAAGDHRGRRCHPTHPQVADQQGAAAEDCIWQAFMHHRITMQSKHVLCVAKRASPQQFLLLTRLPFDAQVGKKE
jgi:hypothetical protein